MSLKNLANTINVLCQKIKRLEGRREGTGATGATGPSGSMDVAYGFFWSSLTLTYDNDIPIRFNHVSGIERNVVLENDFSGSPTIIRVLIPGGYSVRCGISVRSAVVGEGEFEYSPVCRISIDNNPNVPGLVYANEINTEASTRGTMFINGTFAISLVANETIRLFTAAQTLVMDSRVVETSFPGNVTAFLEIQRVTPPIP